jgi:chromosome segregation ATPase
MSEKYVNHYIELLTNTMQDAVLRNISLQTNLKISDEAIGELNQKVEELESIIENLRNENSSSQQIANDQVKIIANDKDRIIDELKKEINILNNMKHQYENVKHQVEHVDTFRNELIKERDEHQKTRDDYESKIKLLNEQIGYLQLTPTKRKKIDDAKSIATPTIINPIEDGGSF